MKKLVLVLFAIFLMGGCFAKKVDVLSKVLDNTYSLENVIEESQIDVFFQKEKIVGNSGVNRYFATYKIDGDKISVGEIGTTRMMGPENLMLQEQGYLKNLKEAQEVRITENGIRIVTKSGVELNFVKK
ncbi:MULTISPECIES: META domain-containing protein [unclassified Cetobacterium]|uniref:META domain-containing protein n=1 Tax=unclassified Cetobacterium TaxID=2630983 RepID=UPI0006472592|nr:MULTISPECIES: META domain-containing protein [unclassified Cetobacterium]